LISIVIPIGNLDRDQKNLETTLGNTRVNANLEIVVVFDFEEITENATHFSHSLQSQGIKVIISNARNPNGARYDGYLASRGNWITFCDSDDEIYLDKLKSCSSDWTTPGNLYVYSFAMDFLDDNVVTSHHIRASEFSFIQNPGLWRCVISSDTLQENFFCNTLMGEDLVLLTGAILNSKSINFFGDEIYKYNNYQPNRLSTLRLSDSYMATVIGYSNLMIINLNTINRNSLIASALFSSFLISSFINSGPKHKFQIVWVAVRALLANWRLSFSVALVFPLAILMKLKNRLT
jgi:glycosyltransferase involved in cell wall biosynthesis